MNESFNSVTSSVTHGQMTLKQSARALCGKMKDIYNNVLDEQGRSITLKPTGVDRAPFQLLIGKISLFAIKRIWTEYLEIRKIYSAGVWATYNVETDYDSCTCPNRVRFSLPCRHILIPVARDNLEFIPLQIVHPQWRLRPHSSEEYLVTPSNWRPIYQQRILRLSPKKTKIYLSLEEILQCRDTLPSRDRECFTEQIQANLNTLLHAVRVKSQEATLPLGQPDIIPKRTFKRKRPTENSRALSAFELVEEGLQEADRQRRQEARDLSILNERQELEEQEETQARPSQGFQFINADVYRLTAVNDDVKDLPPSTDPFTDPSTALPPSTAPAKMTNTTKSGRTRIKTGKLAAAQAAGWIKWSQERL
jgi:hypothetical protein